MYMCVTLDHTFRHLADAFIQSDLQLHSGYTFFISMCVPWESNPQHFALTKLYHWATQEHTHIYIYIYIGAGHIIRISSKMWFISLIPFKKLNLYNAYIHSTQTDIFQVFISFNFDDYNWQLMKNNIYFRPSGVALIVNDNIVSNCKCVKLHKLILT